VWCCIMFGWCALWRGKQSYIKGGALSSCGGGLTNFIATILLLWGSWTISF
jgi:hypothetical protein